VRAIENIEVIRALREDYGVDLGYEAILERSYRRFLNSGDVVLDIGAHTGIHTVKFLECVGDAGLVVAFEPLPDVHRFLLRSLGTRPNLMIFELALSSAPAARAEFVRAEGSLSESGLKRREYNEPENVRPTTTHVEISTIDEIVDRLELRSVNYIKMDIEGGELDAVAGGRQTIRRFRPIISLEYGPQAYGAYGYTEDSLFEVAEQLGYRIFDPFMQDIGDRAVWNFAKNRYCWDYFIVPLERADEARGWNALPA
jgi:FkbM family methyltransferase